MLARYRDWQTQIGLTESLPPVETGSYDRVCVMLHRFLVPARFSMSSPIREHHLMLTRRQLMGRSTLGLGTAALAGLLPAEKLLADEELRSHDDNGGLHHSAKAKRVIYLFMSGGPSQLDLWDYKPKLQADVQ